MILIVVLGLCVCVLHIQLCVHQDVIHLHFIKNKCALLILHIDYPKQPQKEKLICLLIQMY